MREILFRGKSIDNGKWKYSMSLARHATENGIITSYYIGSGYDIVKAETVGQYTGLTDKNGTKIFEGDIVKFAKHIYQIIFESGSFAFLDEQGEMISKIGGINDHCYPLMNLCIECCWEDDFAYDVEVIGNIHDNPELLKGDKSDA